MTDIEIVRLCAEAMGLAGNERDGWPIGHTPWNPLRDDAQALALVKRFCLFVSPPRKKGKGQPSYGWIVRDAGNGHGSAEGAPELNRAICTFVGRLEQAKQK